MATLQFQTELPRRGAGLRSTEPSEALLAAADQCRENPNKWARAAEKVTLVTARAEWFGLRTLDDKGRLRVELRAVDKEKFTVTKGKDKGKEKERPLYDVWIGYIVPVQVDGTQPANIEQRLQPATAQAKSAGRK